MIKLIDCDIFEADVDVLCHQVNCYGVMGSGIAQQVRERYPEVYKAYEAASLSIPNLLGNVLSVKGNDGKTICNLFAQYDRTDIVALEKCLKTVAKGFKGSKIAFPYLMSSDRGGADWRDVECLIMDIFNEHDVTICRLKQEA